MEEKKLSIEQQFALAKQNAVNALLLDLGGGFQSACRDAKMPVTRRQARKWLQSRGTAFKERDALLRKGGL